MKASKVEVYLGAEDILVMSFKRLLTAQQRENVQKAMEAVIAEPGKSFMVLEDGASVQILKRPANVLEDAKALET